MKKLDLLSCSDCVRLRGLCERCMLKLRRSVKRRKKLERILKVVRG
jgi:hypothetical protein